MSRAATRASTERGVSSDGRSRPLVQVEKISKLYPLKRGAFSPQHFVHAVENVSFHVRRAETLGLIGESGCGKTTLGRVILRLLEPTLGRVVFDGQDLLRMRSSELRAVRRRMQIVFQDPYSSLNPRMTVREIVGEGIRIFRLAASRREENDQVAAALERVGLRPEMMERYPHEFSGGQRQRIGIARAIAVQPDFIVCDEPVSALDVSIQAHVLNVLEQLQDDLGLSMLFISHDLRVVRHMSHRIAVMYLGRIVEMGPTKDVWEERYHPYTRTLFNALPSLQADGKRRLVVQGEAASALEPPHGCVFHPRCPRAEPGKCDVDVPYLQEIRAGTHHRVACWHPHVD